MDGLAFHYGAEKDDQLIERGELDAFATSQLRRALSPRKVGEVVVRAATARRPREQYFVPRTARLQQVFMRSLPERWCDGLLRRVYKIAGPPSGRATPPPT